MNLMWRETTYKYDDWIFISTTISITHLAKFFFSTDVTFTSIGR